MIKLIRRVYYTIFIWLLSLRRTLFAFNLGEIAIYKGKKYVLHDGSRSQTWTAYQYKVNSDKRVSIPKDRIKKYWNLKNQYETYRSNVRFYRSNWLSIWINNGIEDWQKSCSIW